VEPFLECHQLCTDGRLFGSLGSTQSVVGLPDTTQDDLDLAGQMIRTLLQQEVEVREIGAGVQAQRLFVADNSWSAAM
jgi:hypothetical protein